jgi:uncharacterized protein
MQSTVDRHEPEQSSDSRTAELTRAECLDLLARQHVGRVAVISGWKTPIIRPVNFLYDEPSQSIVFRTAGGSKLHALRSATRAAFEIDGTDFANRVAWSVIVEGVTTEVTRPHDIARLNGLNLRSWAVGPEAHWIRIGVWAVSGIRVLLAEDEGPERAEDEGPEQAAPAGTQ